VEPVSVDEAKAHMRVDIADDDALIAGLLKAARVYVEDHCRRKLISQSLTATLTDWNETGDFEIVLPFPPLVSVTSVKYYDTAGTLQTWASANYAVDTYATPGRIREAYGVTWPEQRDIENAIQIVYVAGYGSTAASVPEPLKLAIKMLAAHWYENREASSSQPMTQVPLAVDRILAGYRVLEAA